MTRNQHELRNTIEAELLDWMREPQWVDDDARFETLALRLFAFQFEHCDAYARYCGARNATPADVGRWFEIPPVPASAFKAGALTCFDTAKTVKTFLTSGTTTSRRGTLHLDTLALYEASLLPNIRRFVFPEVESGAWPTMSIRVLAPDPAATPDSSLSHMFGVALQALGSRDSGYDVRDGVLDTDALIDHLRRSERPLALCGTAFAFVHLLEALDDDAHGGSELTLKSGSRIMETGGFKGRSREVPRVELYESLSKRLGIPDHHIVNQYGMTELGSQFYDNVLFDHYSGEGMRPRQKIAPPWTRIRLLDPETGEEAAEGDAGIVVIHDLANTGSIAALQTADLGRWVDRATGGFEVLGRAQGADARGCSIAADQRWLEAHR